jgi:pimeloyl-ACP methyl ester carboxylesterase
VPRSAEVDGFRLAYDRTGSGPPVVLWPEHDPLFPRSWSDRLDEFFSRARLRAVDGAGHFVPREAPAAFAAAILERCLESERP